MVKFILPIIQQERFMNVIIQNPNLLDELNNKYKTNYYIFINEFHIGRAYPSKENMYVTNRKISTHYTVFNQKGREIDAGIIKVEMPGDIFGIKKIEYQYLSVIASELCSFIPSAKVEKSTLLKEAEDDKNSKKQRKIQKTNHLPKNPLFLYIDYKYLYLERVTLSTNAENGLLYNS